MLISIRIYLSEKSYFEEQLYKILSSLNIDNYKIIKRSIDARNKAKIIIEYQLLLSEKDGFNILSLNEEKKSSFAIQSIKKSEKDDYSYDEINFNIKPIKPNKIDKSVKTDKSDKIDKSDKVDKINQKNQTDKINDLNKIEKTSEITDYKTSQKNKKRPIIVGFGPAGIFATFAFLENNIAPIIIEMGEKVEDRSKTIEDYMKNKKFNCYSNINFGEGGAGTYSDGKLYTRSRDQVNKKIYFLFNYFGAPSSILYDAHPHIGSDNLVKLMTNIRSFFEEKGVEFFFNTKLIDIEENKDKTNEGRWKLKLLKVNEDKEKETGINFNNNYYTKYDKFNENEDKKNIFEINTNTILLATGHSCKDIYKILYKLGAQLEPKPFAMGFRVEHPRVLIDKNQYGKFHKVLPSANYKLLYKGKNSNIYSFCMCPGGAVLASNSEEEEIVTNGASRYLRDGENSNAAIICSISNLEAKKFIENLKDGFKKRLQNFSLIEKSINFEVGLISKSTININYYKNKFEIEIGNKSAEEKNIKNKNSFIINCLDWEVNLIFQQIFEKIAFYFAKEKFSAPFENISDFFKQDKKEDENLIDKFFYTEKNKPKIPTTYPFGIYKTNLLKLFPDGIEDDFKAAFKYFDKIINGYIQNGIAVGYETRTSSVIKVVRGSEGEVLQGIYMLGEGSGYCGGITTSAVDGYQIASILAKKL